MAYSNSLRLSLSRFTNPYLASFLLSHLVPAPKKGVNDFPFFVGTWVKEETDQLYTLTTVGLWNSGILYLTAPISILPKFSRPPKWGCQRFCISCTNKRARRDRPTILNALTKDGVWNSNITNLHLSHCSSLVFSKQGTTVFSQIHTIFLFEFSSQLLH